MNKQDLDRHARESDTIGTVYLLHLDPPFKHARHYIGFTILGLDDRLQRHKTDRGAKLLRAQLAAGGTWRVAQVWAQVPRSFELVLKRRGGAARCCPICKGVDTAATVDAARRGQPPPAATSGS